MSQRGEGGKEISGRGTVSAKVLGSECAGCVQGWQEKPAQEKHDLDFAVFVTVVLWSVQNMRMEAQVSHWALGRKRFSL